MCVSSVQDSHMQFQPVQKMILPAKLDADNTFLNSWKSTRQTLQRQELKVTLWTATSQNSSCVLSIYAEHT